MLRQKTTFKLRQGMCRAQDFVCSTQEHFLLAFTRLLIFLCPNEKLQSAEVCMEKYGKFLWSDWICANPNLCLVPLVHGWWFFLYKINIKLIFFPFFLLFCGILICGVMDFYPSHSFYGFSVVICNK